MKNRILLTTLISGAVLGLSACGGGGSGGGDTTAPVITVNGGDVRIAQGTAYTDAGASAIDDVDGAIAPAATGTVDITTLGDYTITYTATDAAGNTSTATRTVSVVAAGTVFDGTWQSLTCISGTNTSFKQTNVVIDGSNVTSNIDAWTQSGCPASVTAIPLTLVVDFQYGAETLVAAGCDGPTATEVDVTLQSITALGVTRTGDAAIRALLTSVAPDVGKAVPAFNLLCLGNNQLLSGDVSGTNDGTTAALRPDSMDIVDVLIPK